ncbi:MAG: colanic acid biosynthesis glycosyltransferase WcaL [Candidatus Abyssobacteria bacterium SURF_5]|uniref:Colanic acid biosynthesis glycosyltransferase WcaL n=1 Tax=Abyssobacteria bacterium (strain SURF_5) TaxID=2093360 RepID=A0A3A4NN27_ABYX5|nr:MAG: colanic acid biosynthesis glycosyltransferase WcaL [Candidatus Abyssubacteria bacterium SURF_5]
MESFDPIRVGYVLKMYPRFSETFIVNEMLAHQEAGLDFEIFSLRPANDGRFHESLARLRVPVTYLEKPGGSEGVKKFWNAIRDAMAELPGLAANLEAALEENVNDVYQAIRVARLACARGITHLHAHFASTAASVARLAALFAGLTYSFTAHAKDIYHESVNREDLSRKLNDAAAVITVSDYNCSYLRTSFGLSDERVTRIYNGIDLNLFQYISPLRRAPKIVCVGRLVEKKGFAYLIDACSLLMRSRHHFDAEIIGAGPLEADLRNQIESLGLTERVRLLGPLPQGEVIQRMHEAAVVAAPCVLGSDGDRDGLPTVLLEAMALGTPCISTDVTGIPEILLNEQTGLMVAQNDAAGLAAALERLLYDGELRERLALSARALIESEFDLQRNAAHMRNVVLQSAAQLKTLAL